MNKIELLNKLVSFNTINDKGNSKMINWISVYLEELGFSLKTNK